MAEKEYIEISSGLNEKAIIGEYGADAFIFYQNRIKKPHKQNTYWLEKEWD